MTTLHLRRGRISLRLRALRLGDDLSLTLTGGDREHLGAVALAAPQSGRDGSATASVLTLPGHREDLLARRLALHLAATLGIAVSVACGIHIDAPTRQELQDVEAMADELAAMFLRQFPLSDKSATQMPSI